MGPEEQLLRSRITRERYPVVRPDVEPVPPKVPTTEDPETPMSAK